MIYFRPVAVPPPANLGSRPSFCPPETWPVVQLELSSPTLESSEQNFRSPTAREVDRDVWSQATCIGLTNVGNDAVCQRNSCRS